MFFLKFHRSDIEGNYGRTEYVRNTDGSISKLVIIFHFKPDSESFWGSLLVYDNNSRYLGEVFFAGELSESNWLLNRIHFKVHEINLSSDSLLGDLVASSSSPMVQYILTKESRVESISTWDYVMLENSICFTLSNEMLRCLNKK